MKIKNVSKKIIGNGGFRLLPGDTMDVTGQEVWVRNYLEEKALEIVAPEASAEGIAQAEGEVNPEAPGQAGEAEEDEDRTDTQDPDGAQKDKAGRKAAAKKNAAEV